MASDSRLATSDEVPPVGKKLNGMQIPFYWLAQEPISACAQATWSTVQ